MKNRTFAVTAASFALLLAACNSQINPTQPLPPGASYLYPNAKNVIPARLYAADLRTIAGSYSAYNVYPICDTDFEKSNDLKQLSSHNSLNYGDITVTGGPQVLASLSGIPINSFVTVGGGFSYSNQLSMTFSNVQLIKADADDVAGIISNYLKTKGRRCAGVVSENLAANRVVIVTDGVLAADKATIGPPQTNGPACPASGNSNGASASNGGTNPSSSPSQGAAPLSACVSVGLGKGPSIAVKASDGTLATQSLNGGVIVIVPSQLQL